MLIYIVFLVLCMTTFCPVHWILCSKFGVNVLQEIMRSSSNVLASQSRAAHLLPNVGTSARLQSPVLLQDALEFNRHSTVSSIVVD